MAESRDKYNNLFGDFVKVFTGLLIGLASFQILAPIIWNYLSDLLHLEKFTSYYIIVTFYFILPGLILLTWWYMNRHKIKALLEIHPNGNGQDAGWDIVKVLNIFFPAFLIANFLLLMFSSVFDYDLFFYGIQVLATLAAIVVFYKIAKGVIANIKEERVKRKRKYYTLITFIAALLFLFVLFEVIYLSYSDKTKAGDVTTFNRLKIENKSEIYNAFRLNDFREELSVTRKKFGFNLSRVIQMQELSDFDSSVNPLVNSSAVVPDLFTLVSDSSLSKSIFSRGREEMQGLNDAALKKSEASLLTLVYLMDKASDSIVKRKPDLLMASPPYHLDNLLQYEKIRTIGIADSITLEQCRQRYENIITTLQTLENNTIRLCKKQLTLVLSNHQMKGIFLFGFTLIIMLCLYLLLKTNEDVFAQLSEVKENRDDKVISGKSELNKGALSDVWMIVNVLVWLLIPLFKPVTEESVMIDRPIQSLTFTRYVATEKTVEKAPSLMINSQNPFTVNNYPPGYVQTQPAAEFDTLWLKQELDKISNAIPKQRSVVMAPGDTLVYDDAELREMIKEVQDRVKKINSGNQEASALRRMYDHIMQRTVPEKLKDSDFKPRPGIQ